MKVLFVARAIGGMAGGVERMVTTVMNELTARGHEIELFSWDPPDAVSFFPIDERIRWHRLGLGDPRVPSGPVLKLRRGIAIRAIVRRSRPNLIVCFQEGPFVAIRAYTAGMGVPVVVAERNAPTRFEHTRGGPREGVVYAAFRFARLILIQCESFRALYPEFLRERIVTIPNPVPPARIRARPDVASGEGRFRLLSVGRLGYQKNFAVLIDAFADLAAAFPDWDLAIVGEGEDRTKLEARIAARGLTDRISLPGNTADVSDWYGSSHLFCLPARWEGFPNAVAEAMAAGLPAVGFAGCAGVRDLITAGATGLLADGNGDALALAQSLATLMRSGQSRREWGEAATVSMQKYPPEKVFALWERTLAGVSDRTRMAAA